MSGFPDIEEFARRHAGCGGITPNASTPVGGGYLLTLTCACGATRDRWITAEEARLPLPAPPPAVPAESVAPPAPAPPPAGPTPSPELQEVLREALEAEGVSDAEDEPAPEASPDLQEALRRALEAESEPDAPVAPSPSPDLQDVLRQALEAEAAAPAPPKKEVVPSVDLQAALRRVLETDAPTGASAAKPAASAPSRRLPPPPKGTLDDALKQALRTQPAAVPGDLVTRPPATRFWFGVVVAVGLLVVGGGWYLLADPGALAPAPAAAPETVAASSAPARDAPPAPLTDEGRAAIAEMLQSLHQVQAASTPTTPYATYSSRVLFARADLERFLKSSAPPAVKAAVRETLDVYALASDAWRARGSSQTELLEMIGQSPLIDACPSLRRLADFAEQTGLQTRAHTRGVAVSNAVPTVWECAADKLAAVETAVSAR